MHREILFRGKRIDNAEWVEGDLLRTKFYLDDSEHSLIFTATVEFPRSEFSGANEVIPKTVGQYTGMTDKNGKRIFEGDVVRVVGHESYVNGLYIVKFSDYNHCWRLEGGAPYFKGFSFSDLNGFNTDGEVIGNIHDNPELLGEGDEK